MNRAVYLLGRKKGSSEVWCSPRPAGGPHLAGGGQPLAEGQGGCFPGTAGSVGAEKIADGGKVGGSGKVVPRSFDIVNQVIVNVTDLRRPPPRPEVQNETIANAETGGAEDDRRSWRRDIGVFEVLDVNKIASCGGFRIAGPPGG